MNKEKTNIYIIDDDEPVQIALGRLLRSYGFLVETYSSAQEFLDSVSFDVQGCLILDVKMPGMNGIELQEKLNSSEWTLPIIFITAYETPQTRQKAMSNGAIAFLPKPVNEKDLLNSIYSALK
jgi:FixJ family two-component response regulator